MIALGAVNGAVWVIFCVIVLLLMVAGMSRTAGRIARDEQKLIEEQAATDAEFIRITGRENL